MSVDQLQNVRTQVQSYLDQLDAQSEQSPIDTLHRALQEMSVFEAELLAQNEAMLEAEQEISASYYENLKLFEQAPSAYFRLDSAFKISRMNTEARTLCATRRDDRSMPQPVFFMSLYRLENQSRVLLEWLSNASAAPLEIKFRSDPECWHQLRKRIVGDDDIFVSITDITERYLASARLAQERNRYEQLLESTSDGVIEVSDSGRITLINRAALALFGYTREELLGSKIEVLIPTGMRVAHTQHRAQFKAGNAPRAMTLANDRIVLGRAAGGHEIPVEINLASQDLGNTLSTVATIKDAREKLSLKAARERESRFLSNMSHEIRNPLNGVKGLLQNLLARNDTSGDIRESLELALGSAEHLHALVNDILDFKKLEENEYELRNEAFDLKKRLAGVHQTNNIIAHQRQIELLFEDNTDDGPLMLWGDATRIIQIAQNLLSNALKFTDKSGLIRFTTAYNRDTSTLILTCRDNGIGMSAATLELLFNRFQQGTEGQQKDDTGTGIGLALTKRLVELMNGYVDVESVLGQGSTFTVYIQVPVASDEQRGLTKKQVNQKDRQANDNPDLRHLNILCVDDVKINLMVIAAPLEKAGASVSVATSAQEALELLKEHDFQLIYTDISMPWMSGEELLARVQQQPSPPPVIAVTGNVLENDVERYGKLGFSRVIAKPIVLNELMSSAVELTRAH